MTVTVPVEQAETLKTFARLLRNSDPAAIRSLRTQFEEYLADSYRDFDEWCAANPEEAANL